MKRLVTLAVLTLAAPVLVLVDASTAVAASRYQVTAQVSATSITLGQRVVLKGRVSPAARGQKVSIQERRPGASTWRTLKSVRIGAKSRYTTVVVPKVAGGNAYRVLKPRSNGHPAGVSPVRIVTVWRWRSLASLPQTFPSNGTTVEASVVLGTHTYRPAIRQGNGGHVTYQLDGKCARFDAYAGAHPGSSNPGPFTQHIYGALIATPNSADQPVSTNQVIVGNDPNHIIRGAGTMLRLDNIRISSNGFLPADNPNDATVLAGARVFCKS